MSRTAGEGEGEVWSEQAAEPDRSFLTLRYPDAADGAAGEFTYPRDCLVSAFCDNRSGSEFDAQIGSCPVSERAGLPAYRNARHDMLAANTTRL